MATTTNGICRLTPKQQAYAYAYVETGVEAEAYRQAYNASGMSANAVRVEACRLLKNPNVALMVQRLREKAAERVGLNVADVLVALMEDRALARKLGNPSAAIRADELLGKHIGMWPTRIKATVDHKHTHALDDASVDELRAMLAEIRAKRAALEGQALKEGRVIEGTVTVVE